MIMLWNGFEGVFDSWIWDKTPLGQCLDMCTNEVGIVLNYSVFHCHKIYVIYMSNWSLWRVNQGSEGITSQIVVVWPKSIVEDLNYVVESHQKSCDSFDEMGMVLKLSTRWAQGCQEHMGVSLSTSHWFSDFLGHSSLIYSFQYFPCRAWFV